jgi:hypothetical protein
MLTDSTKSRLLTFWSSLPTGIRNQLLTVSQAAASADPSSQQLYEILSGLEGEAEQDSRLAHSRFYFPMENLIGDPAIDPPSRAYFTPQFLDSLWNWFDEASGGTFAKEASADDSLAWSDSWTQRRETYGNKLSDFIKAAEGDRKAESRLVAMWGAGGSERANDAAILLIHGAALARAAKDFPDEISDLNPDLCTRLRDAHEAFSESAAEAGLWLLLIVMARLKKTAQIFRAIEKIGRRGDDLLVSKTDLATVGDAVFSDAEHYAARLKQIPESMDAARSAADGLAHYTSITVGMTREFGIRKDGRWGKQLFGLRSQVSTDLEKIFSSVDKALSKALPEPRKGHRGALVPQELPDETIIESACAKLYFVASAGEWATQAAVGSIQKKTEELAIATIDECFSALITLVQHTQGDEQVLASKGLEVIARLTEAVGQDENAALIRRRSAAALAA